MYSFPSKYSTFTAPTTFVHGFIISNVIELTILSVIFTSDLLWLAHANKIRPKIICHQNRKTELLLALLYWNLWLVMAIWLSAMPALLCSVRRCADSRPLYNVTKYKFDLCSFCIGGGKWEYPEETTARVVNNTNKLYCNNQYQCLD